MANITSGDIMQDVRNAIAYIHASRLRLRGAGETAAGSHLWVPDIQTKQAIEDYVTLIYEAEEHGNAILAKLRKRYEALEGGKPRTTQGPGDAA